MSKIDLSKPPYQVPCPVCKAFAMALCQTERGGKLLQEPHDVRWAHWGMSPQLRVKVTDDTWTRWSETFQEWANRMIIHCPTARTYGELMFFAAEKLDMTTDEYFNRFFHDLSELALQQRLLID
jgi:hypothetical protein